MDPRDQNVDHPTAVRPGTAALAAALAPLAPPIVGWILAVALSGPPDYAAWPYLFPLVGVLSVPVVAGVMTRVLASWRLGLLPLLVAGLAGAVFGAWWGGLFAPPVDPSSGPALGGLECVNGQVKGIAYAVVAAGAIVVPAGITAWLVGPTGDRRRVVLAVVAIPPLFVVIGLVLFLAVSNLLTGMGPPGCQLLYLG